jgi:hypothetical protein
VKKKVLVQALFYVDGIDPNASGIPDILKEKFNSKLDKMMKSSKLSTVIKKIFKKKRVKKRDNFVNTKP